MTATNTVDTNPASSVYAALNSTTKTKTNANSMTEAEDRFLKLLVTQLKNQDPLNPMDNAQMTSQMAQISTVNGIEKLNTTLQALMNSNSQSQTMQAASLVGKGVLVPGANLNLKVSEGPAIAGFELAGPVDGASVTINDSNGIAVRTITLGGMAAGTHLFQWDGNANSGAVAADGPYTFSVAAKLGSDKADSTALQFGTINSVLSSSQGVSLNVGSLGIFKVSDVKEFL